MSEKIEILSLDIFNTHKAEMEIVESIQKYFEQGIGWHYHLDLAWLIKEIRNFPRGAILLDAGAGHGLTQFIIAELGYNVISADFVGRAFNPKHLKRYGKLIYYLNDQDYSFNNPYTRHLKKSFNTALKIDSIFPINRLFRRFLNRPDKANINLGAVISIIEKNRHRPSEKQRNQFPILNATENCGKIFIYKCDLKDMPLLPDNFVDGVVSVSALEHNEHKDTKKCVAEMLRVTKPGGRLFLTVSASQSKDWFHNPSKGWCYSENTLKRLFDLPEHTHSNYFDKERMFDLLKKENNELHRRLSPSYFKSGNNGMPWGKWDPKYQPVGIIKNKSI